MTVGGSSGAADSAPSDAVAIDAPVEGRLEAVVDGHVIGWAWCPSLRDARLSVSVLVDGSEVAAGRAADHRASLADAGIGDGAHVFRVALPQSLADSGEHSIAVRVVPSGAAVPPSPNFRAETSTTGHPFAGTTFTADPARQLPSRRTPTVRLPALRLPALRLPALRLPALRLPAWRSSPDTWAIVAIVAAVLIANFVYLAGITDANPLDTTSGLASSTRPGLIAGVNTIDPNIGYTSQALGHRVALDWLHLHLPWWNPYEGIGAPLAGEMQSGALFPPTLLLAFDNGLLYEHVLLELIGGIATYFLLRRLELRRWAALAGAIAFALNGTQAWLGNAAANPVAFLPLLLLGLEMAYAATVHSRRGGWGLLAVAGALSVYAGFPEVAYVDTLLAVGWFVWRCGCAGRERLQAFATKVALGALVGTLLAAPIIVPFVNYLQHADVGLHSGLSSTVRLVGQALPSLVLPYVYGPIYTYDNSRGDLTSLWGSLGGYLTPTLLVFGLLGLTAPGRRGLRIVLGVWLLLALSRMYGQPPVLGDLLGVLPGMSAVEFARYAFPSVELAAVVLLALGLDGIRTPSGPPRRLAIVGTGAMAVVVLAALGAQSLVSQLHGGGHQYAFFDASVAWAVVVVVLGIGAALLGADLVPRRPRWLTPASGLIIACTCAVLDAVAMFAAPSMSAPRSVRMDFAPTAYLRAHLGLGRFFTLGPISPDFGAYFGTPSININDLPIPASWSHYVNARLDPYVHPRTFVGYGQNRPPGTPTTAQELLINISGYRAAGVEYVIAQPGQRLPASPATLTLVFRSPIAWIYRLSGAEPYFSASGGSCTIKPSSAQSVQLSCDKAVTLIRRELYFPGWTAEVDGRPATISREGGIFQGVAVGAGTHRLSFGYAPPRIGWALLAFLIGCGWLGAGPLWFRRRPSERGSRRIFTRQVSK